MSEIIFQISQYYIFLALTGNGFPQCLLGTRIYYGLCSSYGTESFSITTNSFYMEQKSFLINADGVTQMNHTPNNNYYHCPRVDGSRTKQYN